MDAAFHAGDELQDEVNAFSIKAATDKGVDYMKLIERFGSDHITPDMVARLERLTGCLVPLCSQQSDDQ
jgi:hypothetical protein